jgi:lipopolysaccharide/colanic/teichoic acid biosynthesis glycosyltransferase
MVTSNSWQRILATVNPADWAGKSLEEAFRGDWAPLAKRMLDLGVALPGLVLLLPLLAAIALAVKLESRGPILYVSRRLGRNARVFHCLKFRTMTEDYRETRLGSLLRRFGLDELPQLVNVVRGEMSVVGPRPRMASDSPTTAVFRLRRLELMPGMTGLWAAHQLECPPFTPYVSPDETYRRNWSVWLDMVIVVRSIGAALAGRER